MARIRTIKPDAYKSDTLSVCSPLARWMFAGLWTYCDDYGRGRNDARLIKAELFPLDDTTTLASVAGCLAELVAADGAVCTYEVDGKSYLHMPKWKDHQRVSHPTPSKIPECPKHAPAPNPVDSGAAPEDFVKPPEPLRPEGNREGNREQGTEGIPRASRKRHIPDDWAPNDKHAARAAQLELDLAEEVEKFRDYDKSKGPIWKDFDAAFNNWLRNNAKWGNSSRNPNGPTGNVDWDAAMGRAKTRDAS